jgi:hypothetical protein
MQFFCWSIGFLTIDLLIQILVSPVWGFQEESYIRHHIFGSGGTGNGRTGWSWVCFVARRTCDLA